MGQDEHFYLILRNTSIRQAQDLVTTPQPLCVFPQVLQVNSLIQTQKSGELAAALLSVYVERAEDLPVRPPHAP